MRIEEDFIGKENIPENALYGIHSLRAKSNFPHHLTFSPEWYMACGLVKKAAYITINKMRLALNEKEASLIQELKIPDSTILEAMSAAAEEISEQKHLDQFIVPAIQGGAGTSINLNINEIISNRALQLIGSKPGDYHRVDPIEAANLYQSTNDVIPTALIIALMKLLKKLEIQINQSRSSCEALEKTYRNTRRLSYTQMQGAVPGTYGQLFSAYNDALSRDWWRVSKSWERIKQVNLGGGATGSGLSIPRFYIMEVVKELRELTQLPLAQAENLHDATSNLDSLVEVHAILKAHAVNLEKMANDLRLLSANVRQNPDLKIPDKQTGSSIMPGKVNPVIPEFIISGAHTIYSNDLLITNLAAQGTLDLNAYLPVIGHKLIESLKMLISLNQSFSNKLLQGIEINEQEALKSLYANPSITTALNPYIGYHKANEIANCMNQKGIDIFAANKELNILSHEKLEQLLQPDVLHKKGFTIQDLKEFNAK